MTLDANENEKIAKTLAKKYDSVPMSVIEDIKAEIIKWIEIDVGSSNYDAGLKRALCIIDKHISGKER